jgi:hypothetical protein
VAVSGHECSSTYRVECAMLFGVAAIVTSLIISALAAVVVDSTYQALSERRWSIVALPLIAFLAIVVGASMASPLG